MGTDEAQSPAGLKTVEPDWIDGLDFRTSTADGENIDTMAKYPVIPGANSFTVDVRTTMAENASAFVQQHSESADSEGGSGEETRLEQSATFLVASGTTLGLRITAERTVDSTRTSTATTSWYDVRSQQILPWTALFRGKDAITALAGHTGWSLQRQRGLTTQDLPKAMRAAATEASPSAAPKSGAPPKVAPEAARELAAELEGSLLDDVGFDAAGNLVVSFSPGVLGFEQKVSVTVRRELAEPLLSGFGTRVQANVTDGKHSTELSGQPPGYTLDCARVRCVALTFDDGPGPYTARLLDYLDRYSAKATFYVLGQLVETRPEVLRRAVQEGHQVDNHSWSHDNLAGMSASQVEADIARTDEAIESATGVPVRTVRPPYGSFNETTKASVAHPLILWDVDTLDWQTLDTGDTEEAAISESSPGSIVLFHDIHKTSVEAIPRVLAELRADGYHFVTVSQLFGDQELKPGHAYRRRQE